MIAAITAIVAMIWKPGLSCLCFTRDAGGYMISRQNNLELHLIELFYIGIQPEVRTDGRSVSRSGGRTVTWFRKFLGWVDNQIFLPIARENDLRERIPHTCPSSHENYFNLFLVLCHTAWLFQGRNLIGRLEWRHVILNLAGNSFHCRSRKGSDMTCKLGFTFVDENNTKFVVE